MAKTLLFLSLFFLIISENSANNKQDSVISISGQVVDSKSLQPIPLATITIKRSRKGRVCDSLGVFHLQVKQMDTLQISILGYQSKSWPVPLIINPDFPPFFQIKLKEISFLLDEVDIYALGTWDEFKREFIATKLKEKNPINSDIKKQLAPYSTKKPNVVPAMYRPKREHFGVIGAIFAPTDFLYSKLSKSEKTKKKMAKRIRNEGKTKKIATKYNADVVAKITGLTGDELIAFMEFCGSHIRVTEHSSDYEITKQVLEWFEKFKQEPTTKE